MKSYNGIRRVLGTRAALAYLHDYHCGRVNRGGTWDDALHTLWQYGVDESEVAAHARFMDECGADFIKYRHRYANNC